MKIAIGSDRLGFTLKKELIESFSDHEISFVDFGNFEGQEIDYPDVAIKVAEAVKRNEVDRGVLICGTGIGMQISANKVPGVYAAVCHDEYSTQRSILSNNINVMCMGAIVIGVATAKAMMKTWLSLEFIESPSRRKIDKIKVIEESQLLSGGSNV